MPRFTAPITKDDPIHHVAYSLAVEAPWVDPAYPPPWTNAFIVPGIVGCAIAEELAREYDPTIQEGDVLYMTVIEEVFDRDGDYIRGSEIHRYKLGMPVKFTGGGPPDLIRISIQHLQFMFDIECVEPQVNEDWEAEHLVLNLRVCVKNKSRGYGETDDALALT